MPDFSNYAALAEDAQRPREFVFEHIGGRPSILTLPATTANKRYNAARLKTINKRTKGGRAAGRISPSSIEAARAEDADMISKFCATGWGVPPVDATTGQPVPFSPDNCREFLLAIPYWMMDEFRAWVSEPLNFTDDDCDEADQPGESPACSPSASDGNSDSSATGIQ